MSLISLLEKHRTKTGRLPSLKAIRPLLSDREHKRLEVLCKTLPIKAAAYVLDRDYPTCKVCGKRVTKLSTNRRENPDSPFNDTCSLACTGVYRVTQSKGWVERHHATFKAVKRSLKKNKNFLLISKETDPSFRVACLRCGKEKETSPKSLITGSISCRCVVGAKISKAKLMPETIFHRRAKLKKRKICLVGGYLGMNKYTKAKCLVCSHIWKVLPGNLLKKSGCPECSTDKMRFNSLCKYGVEYSIQRPEVKAKSLATMRERYGVDYALQNKEILEKNLKSAYTFKSYKLGKRNVQVQGYEPQALDYLIKTKGVKPKDIRCGLESRMPTIKYLWKGKERIYHPDIFVVSQNRIIEVKSSYTASVAKSLEAKRQACKEQGYKFTLLIMGEKGERLNEC